MEDKLLEALKWACHITNIQKICENCSNEEFEACQAQCAAENKMALPERITARRLNAD